VNRRDAILGMVCMTAVLPAGAEEAPSGGFPRELVDALGRRVVVPRAPQRIVVVFPSNVELAWALGLADRVVAIGGRVRWPEDARAKPSIGGALGYSAEAVAAFQPDLLVVTPSHHSALSLVDAFDRAKLPCVVLAHPDLPSVFRNIDLLGRATGADEQARRVREDMQARLAAIERRLAGAPRRSVYFETAAAARGAFQTVGTGHYANDALGWAGGRNVFADLQGAAQVSAEAIFARDPDVIVSLQQVPRDPALIGQRPGWHTLRAVRTKRVVVLERGHKLIPGPRQIEAVEQYARALHPERFA
jgi:iron complex transport system substrate-binding protein